MNDKDICQICGQAVKNKGWGAHLKKHTITMEEYYISYLKKPNEGLCANCGSPTRFLSKNKGYLKFCCYQCARKHPDTIKKLEQTCLKKFGTRTPLENKDILKKTQQTCLKRYGNINPWATEKGKESIKETNLERYGVEYSFQSTNNKEKTKATSMSKYGTEYPNQSSIVKAKISQKIQLKYGQKWITQTDYFKEKSKHTCLRKYNVDNAMKSKLVQNKAIETMKKNNSYSKSKLEDEAYSKLANLYPNTKRQYKSDEYPFNCDFYIPEKDLYIECNFHWTHNNHFFNRNDEEDLKLLENLKEKAKTSNYYKRHITTWTKRDLRKLQIAKKNNLNYLIFWTIDELNNWIEYLRKQK